MSGTAVFIDRDDTVIKDKVYLSDPDGVELLQGAAEGIRLLNAGGIPVIMVTNQSGIARGYLDEERLGLIHERLIDLLAAEGAKVDAVYYCPHHPEGAVEKYAVACECRKPAPGMLAQAAHDFGLDLASCFMIGDKPEDIETILNVGGKGILVKTGSRQYHGRTPDFVADDLIQAAQWILGTFTW